MSIYGITCSKVHLCRKSWWSHGTANAFAMTGMPLLQLLKTISTVQRTCRIRMLRQERHLRQTLHQLRGWARQGDLLWRGPQLQLSALSV